MGCALEKALPQTPKDKQKNRKEADRFSFEVKSDLS